VISPDRYAEHAASCHHQAGCITCGDEATPMKVLDIDAERALALCAAEDGEHHSVEVALVSPVEGDFVLVHAGTAIARLETGETSEVPG